jgi:ABC-2 type transport system permease protein
VAEELRAFSGSRALVVLLPTAATTALIGAAAWLQGHRDFGGAYVAPRDTAPARTRLLTSPIGLALRLDRVTIMSWTAAVAALFVCGQLAAARDDESSHRLETLFALPYRRGRWLEGRIALTLAGTAACALAAGAGAGLGVLVTGAHMSFPRGLEAGLNVLPTEVLFLGIGVLFFALAPRRGVGFFYALVVVTFVWELFGALVSAPGWALDLSPFHHLAPVPAKPFAFLSALVMVAVRVSAAALGTIRFRHRDLTGD